MGAEPKNIEINKLSINMKKAIDRIGLKRVIDEYGIKRMMDALIKNLPKEEKQELFDRLKNDLKE